MANVFKRMFRMNAILKILIGLTLAFLAATLFLAFYKSFSLVELPQQEISDHIAQISQQRLSVDSVLTFLTTASPNEKYATLAGFADSLNLAIAGRKIDQATAAQLKSELAVLSKGVGEIDVEQKTFDSELSLRLKAIDSELKSTLHILEVYSGDHSRSLYSFIIDLVKYLLIMLLVMYLLVEPGILKIITGFLRFIRGFKGFGIELSFGEDKEGNREIRDTVQTSFKLLRDQVTQELASFDAEHDLYPRLSRSVNAIVKHEKLEFGNGNQKYRCTIHVPDLLFQDYLCQLTEYYPGRGASRGRAWTIYHGIIGKVWRTNISEIKNFANEYDDEELRAELISLYGMTKEEVLNPNRDRRAFMSVLLKEPKQGLPLGVLYMDAVKSNLFGGDMVESESPEIFDFVRDNCKEIIEILESYRKLKAKGPLIEII